MDNGEWTMRVTSVTRESLAMQNNVVLEKSFDFAVRIVRLYRYLAKTKNEFVLSKQLLRSGTSIGANVTEANEAFSRNEFAYKMSIALKKCSESSYWIELLYRTDYLTEQQYSSVMSDCVELKRLLTVIVKTAKMNLKPGGGD